MTLGCMMSNSSGQVYTTLRYIAGIGNLLICVTLVVIVRKYTFFSHKSNFLVLATLVMTFICDLCPHLLSFLSYTFSNYNISNSLGLYSLLASAVESCCCGLIYRCSLRLKTQETLFSKHSNKTVPSSNRVVVISH
uniref:Uncharacterized protein n=1 Tax=Panagrolaimus sp. JU765 TaxID=591449 RepID=A0AC34RJ38_9BILA